MNHQMMNENVQKLPQTINGLQGTPQQMSGQGSVQMNPWVESPEKKARRAAFFEAVGVPTALFALLYTVCLYNNYGSIMMPLFVLITLVYVWEMRRRLRRIPGPDDARTEGDAAEGAQGQQLSAFDIFCMAGMILLGVSTSCTGSEVLQWMNNIGIFLLLVTMLVNWYCDIRNWTLSKAFLAVNQAIFGAVGELGEPFSDLFCYRKGRERKKKSRMLYLLAGGALSVPLLVIILKLLYHADAVFAHVMDAVFRPNIRVGTGFGVALTLCFAYLAAYCGLRYLHRGRITSVCRDHRHWEPLVANTVLTLVALVYLMFSLIQILYLFWGGMELPEGYTYAEYAREGFFQLLFVCILNVFLVLFFVGCFRESRYKRVLLTIISLCTYIMLASSAMRMCLYIQAYDLTFLRLFVLWALAFLAILLAGIAVSVYRRTFPIFRYTAAVTTVCVLCLTFARPDYWIASYNIAQADGAALRDEAYLTHLSTDAAPAIAAHEETWARDYAAHIETYFSSDVRHYNFSRARAGKLFDTKEIE